MGAQIKRVTIAEAIMGTIVIASASTLISAGVVSVLLLDDYTKSAQPHHSSAIFSYVQGAGLAGFAANHQDAACGVPCVRRHSDCGPESGLRVVQDMCL